MKLARLLAFIVVGCRFLQFQITNPNGLVDFAFISWDLPLLFSCFTRPFGLVFPLLLSRWRRWPLFRFWGKKSIPLLPLTKIISRFTRPFGSGVLRWKSWKKNILKYSMYISFFFRENKTNTKNQNQNCTCTVARHSFPTAHFILNRSKDQKADSFVYCYCKRSVLTKDLI
jgi:hypothetical protein